MISYTKFLRLFIIVATLSFSVGDLYAYTHDFEVNGLMYNIIDDNTVEILGTVSIEHYNKIIIPDKITYNNKTYCVTSLQGSSRYWDCNTIHIPSSIKSIGYTDVIYPMANVSYIEIEDIESFCKIEKSQNWSGLNDKRKNDVILLKEGVQIKKVTIPASITDLPSYSFQNISLDEVRLEEGVKSIGNLSFAQKGPASIFLPTSIDKIGSYAFNMQGNPKIYISSLTQWIDIDKKDAVSGNPYSLFINNEELTRAVIPSGTEIITSYLFCNVCNIEGVIIPESVKKIGNRAFAGASSLKNIYINGIIPEIATDAFYGQKQYDTIIQLAISDLADFLYSPFPQMDICLYLDGEPLLDIEIPDGIDKIESHKFQNISMKSVKIPSSVKEIGEYAFAQDFWCPTIKLSEGLHKIGKYAFACNKRYDFNKEKWVQTTINTVPSSVNEIGDYAFSACLFPSKLELGPAMTKISEGIFYKSEFNGISLSENIESIGKLSFSESNINKLSLPASCKAIQSSAFIDCKNLEELILPKCLTTIGEKAFYGCEKLKDLNFTDTDISEIEENAFSGCTSFKNIDLQCRYLKSVSEGSFRDCGNLDSLIFGNNITVIKDSAFFGSPTLYYKLGDKIEEIGNYALRSRDDNFVIPFPTSLKKLGEYGLGAYVSISDLSAWCNMNWDYYPTIRCIDGVMIEIGYSLIIPDDVRIISPKVFAHIYKPSYGFKSIIIPSSVEEIGEESFKNWKAQNLIIGENVKKIGENAFAIPKSNIAAEGISRIISLNPIPPEISDNTFENIPENIILYVPQQSVNDYYTKWTHFSNILPIKDNDVLELPVSEFETTLNKDITLKFDQWGIDISDIGGLSITDPKIAQLEQKYVYAKWYYIKPQNVGHCDLEIYNIYGKKSVYPITIYPPLVESLKINPTEWNGDEGECLQLKVNIEPENAGNKTLIWSSSDNNVASVDNDGLVTLIKEGACTITARTTDGSDLCAECIITSRADVNIIFDVDEKIDLYHIDGHLIISGINRDYLKTLTKGVYIIRQNNKYRKVFLR